MSIFMFDVNGLCTGPGLYGKVSKVLGGGGGFPPSFGGFGCCRLQSALRGGECVRIAGGGGGGEILTYTVDFYA